MSVPLKIIVGILICLVVFHAAAFWLLYDVGSAFILLMYCGLCFGVGRIIGKLEPVS